MAKRKEAAPKKEKNKGGAPLGNQNAIGNNGGIDKYIPTPEILEQLFEEYKEWVLANPFLVHDFVGKDAIEVYKQRQRPLSWDGFEKFLRKRKIIAKLDDYRSNKDNRYVEFADIIYTCDKEINSDQFEGAAAGVYQQNIIARKLGLVDKKETDNRYKIDSDIDYSQLSDEALEEIARAQRKPE